jgi:hypothetical protein
VTRGYVYFIETEDAQYIKIGHSVNPITRLAQIGTWKPVRLLGYMPGSRDMETSLHSKFASDRTSGEWFRASNELRLFISTLDLTVPIQPSEAVEQETVKASSVYLPAGLHLRLRTRSLHEGRSMNQILISAAELYLKQGEKQQ